MTITADLVWTVVQAFNAVVAVLIAAQHGNKSEHIGNCMVWAVVATMWLTLLVQR